MDIKNALFDAYASDDYDMIKSLYVVENADIKYIKEILNEAIKDKNENMIKYLSDLTLDEDILTSALLYYIESGNFGMVKYVVDRGANVNGMNFEGKVLFVPILEAAKYGDLDILMYLIDAGAQVDYDKILDISTKKGYIDIINYINQKTGSDGENIQDTNIAKNTQNYDDLFNAIQNGDIYTVRYLVKSGIDITAFNNLALKIAKDEGNEEIYNYLLSHGARPEKKITELLSELMDIEDTAKNVIAEDVSSFDIDIFSDPNIVKDMIELFNQGRSLGKGAVGEAIVVEDMDSITPEGNPIKYIVKQIKACTPGMNRIFQMICDEAMNGSIVFFVPDTLSNKYKLSIPPYFFELIIGSYINNLFQSTQNFLMTYGGVYDSITYNTYIVMEYLDVKITDRITNVYHYNRKEFKKNVYYILFQTCYALNFAQRYSRFVHHDLHWGNLMGRSKKVLPVCYKLDDDNYFYTLTDFNTVLIDYGFARYETKKTVMHPQIEFHRQGKFPGGLVESFIFNPYYDIMTLFLHIFTGPTADFFKDHDVVNALRKVLLPLFYDFIGKMGETHIKRFSTDHSWRGSSYLLYTNEYNLLNPEQLMKRISTYLCSETDKNLYSTMLNDYAKREQEVEKPNFPIDSPNMEDSTMRILDDKLYKDNFILLDRFVNFGFETEKVGINFETENMPKEMDIRYYKSKIVNQDTFDSISIELKTYDRDTMIDGDIHNINEVIKDPVYGRGNCEWKTQYITHAVIKKREINKDNNINLNYKFRFDCCDIDLRNYFQSEKIEKGICINASFFRILNDYTPIGYFKYDGYTNDTSIPQFYNPFFRSIIITENGYSLDIVSTDYARGNGYNAMTVGPILIENNIKIFTEHILNIFVNNENSANGPPGKISIFQCSEREKGNKDKTGDRFLPEEDREYNVCNNDDKNDIPSPFNYVPNCETIKPGELSHASNLNPRSALIICNDGSIIFVYVEGRGARGSGMDMVQLANYCEYLGTFHNGTKHAINLDGGMSSNIVWRSDEYIKSTNPEHQFTYPVGTIISCVKLRK